MRGDKYEMLPPVASPLTPTCPARAPAIESPSGSSAAYTSAHVAPGPTGTVTRSALTAMSLNRPRSSVTPPPPWPACPPDRM